MTVPNSSTIVPLRLVTAFRPVVPTLSLSLFLFLSLLPPSLNYFLHLLLSPHPSTDSKFLADDITKISQFLFMSEFYAMVVLGLELEVLATVVETRYVKEILMHS